MSKLSATSDTVKQLGISGIGTDAIGHRLYLFQQLDAKIISYVPNGGGYGGIYYIEGDATDFIAGYDYFWINSRSSEDKNVFQKSSAVYDSLKLWTALYVTTTAVDSSTYTANISDQGFNICGRVDITNIIAKIGNIKQQIVEEGSIGNSVAAQIEFTLDDADRVYYDKVNKSGKFFMKNSITELISVASNSEYSPASEIYTTYVKVSDLSSKYVGSDFQYGYVEFLTGGSAGKRSLITNTNGHNFKVLGHHAKSNKQVGEYYLEARPKDRVRVFKSPTFWFRLDLWHRDYISDKLSVITGKIDNETVSVQDKQRTVSVVGYGTVKDLMNKDLSDLDFDSGLNLLRMQEIKALYIDRCANKSLKVINRSALDPNPLEAITVLQVGFDVSEGWHFVDYHPQGNLFRFDFGLWFQAKDEGSFEKSTNSIFLASSEDATDYNYPAVLPDHSLESNTLEQNVKIERKWHGKWCSITVAVQEDFYVGSVNNQRTKDSTTAFKKFSGLPQDPYRLTFRVTKEREIADQQVLSYAYDNGETVVPNLFFDKVMTTGGEEFNYATSIGAQMDRKDSATPIWDDTSADRLRLYSLKKFNGIFLKFADVNAGYDSSLTRMFQHLQLRFSSSSPDASWTDQKGMNWNPRYAGGYCNNAPADNDNLTLNTYVYLLTDFDTDYHANMWLVSLSGSNFMEEKKIKTWTPQLIPPVGNLTLIDIVLETGFTNNISQNDKFVVINKEESVRCIDVGDSTKDGDSPDVIAKQTSHLTVGSYYDVIVNQHTNVKYSDLIFKPGDLLHVGHRSKFSSFSIGCNIDTVANNDYADIAWYLRNDFVELEYWNGLEWIKATNVQVVPTSVLNIKDTSSTLYSDDDGIKYKIFFEAEGWNTGSYDNALYGSAGAPSDIDENQIYMVRMQFSISMPIMLEFVSLNLANELNLAIFWENIPNWSTSSVFRTDGKYIVDTLNLANLSLDYYFVELINYDSYSILSEAKPIEKLIGSGSDVLYTVIDPNNIDQKVTADVLVCNPNKNNNISAIPRNINYNWMMEKIVDDSGFKFNKTNKNHLDNYNDFDNNYPSLIGSNYDGCYPVSPGWAGALVSEDLSTYAFSGSYQHICTIRDNGTYKAYAVHADLGGIDLWTSTDMKTWTNTGNIVANIGDYNILAIDVVKNKSDSDYAFFIIAADTAGVNRYKLFVLKTATETAIDMATVTEILDLVTQNVGSCSVLAIKGKLAATSDCRRIMWITAYDDLNVDGSNIPTDSSDIWYYENYEDNLEGLWRHSNAYAVQFDEINNAINPCFIKGNFAENLGNDDDDNYDNMHFEVVYLTTGGTRLAKIFAPYQDGTLYDSWETGPLTAGNFLDGFSVVKDTNIYNLRDITTRDAFTMIPTTIDAFIMIGLSVGTNTPLVKVVDLEVSDHSPGYLKSVAAELNGYDWFCTDSNDITLDNEINSADLYLGFDKKFNKLDAIPNSLKLSDKFLVQYWDGTAWQNFDTMYQNRNKISDSEIWPLFSCYWDTPIDWKAAEISAIDAYSYFSLEVRSNSLYWIKISLSSDYAGSSTATFKGFRSCYTNLFLTKGRNLYLMENWSYVKSIYTFGNEVDKNLKIDSMSHDKSGRLILVNLVEDGMYDYRIDQTYVFDIFGKHRGQQPVWDNGDTHICLKDRPESIYRVGYENEVDASIGSGFETFKVQTIGYWDDAYIEGLYRDGTFAGNEHVGYNCPVPKPQFLRKFSIRNGDWELTGSFWDIDFVNNAYLLKSGHPTSANNFSDNIISSITNSGLLNEELVNGPFRKVAPGFYGALERSLADIDLKVHLNIEDEITSLPGVPVADANYLVVTGAGGAIAGKVNEFATYVDSEWSYSIPSNGTIIYITDTVEYKWWDGQEWREFGSTVVWPGREDPANAEGIGLEFTMGQTGVKVPYFRPYNNKPTRFLNNNTNQYLDDKMVISHRHIPLGVELANVFGHPGYPTGPYPFNLKPTCAAAMEDLASIKDSDGTDSTRDILELGSPAMVFGSYMFKDVELSDTVEREEAAGDDVNPYGVSAVNVFKSQGRAINCLKAFYYDGAATTYTVITDDMNYKDSDNSYDMDHADDAIFLCLDRKFFSILMSANETFLSNDKYVNFLDTTGTWQSLLSWSNYNGFNATALNQASDLWTKKTSGTQSYWDPFRNDWDQETFEGTTGYWIRIKGDSNAGAKLFWAVINGYCLWDSMRWWNDYTITSDVLPAAPTDAQKRLMDTYVPLSIDYDPIRKRVTGCFWDFTEDKYYPFSETFDQDKLRTATANIWSWEGLGLNITDTSDFNYFYKLQSIKSVSPVDSKAILIDDSKPDSIALMANLKNWDNGQSLFTFTLGS